MREGETPHGSRVHLEKGASGRFGNGIAQDVTRARLDGTGTMGTDGPNEGAVG